MRTHILERVVKELGHRIGIDIRRHRPVEARRVARLHSLGISAVLDVGANQGQYASALRGFGYRGRIISFEPASVPFLQLRRLCQEDEKWEGHRLALGDLDTDSEINIASNTASSSLLRASPEHAYRVPQVSYSHTERVPVRRLDSLQLDLSGPLMMKLDVQGFEDRVLIGAADTLGDVLLVECELSLSRLYDLQPSFRDMIELLFSLGFELVDIDPILHDCHDGRVLQVDGTFARTQLLRESRPSLSR